MQSKAGLSNWLSRLSMCYRTGLISYSKLNHKMSECAGSAFATLAVVGSKNND